MNSKFILLIVTLIMLVLAISGNSFAGPIEVQSFHISPDEIVTGRLPEITGSIKANFDPAVSKEVEINVIASLVLPSNIVRSWTWKNIRMITGEIRNISVPKDFDTRLAGVYKIDFNEPRPRSLRCQGFQAQAIQCRSEYEPVHL